MGRRLTVGEASRALGMSRTTLLAAEESGLLVPIRTPGGHRRYEPAELDRFLARHRPTDVAAAPVDRPAPAGPAPHLGPAVRSVVGPLVRALDADIAGVYLDGGSGLRFCAAFGIPRWLAERLERTAAPPVLEQACTLGRHRVFDPAEIAFPEARSTGHGVAVPVCPGSTGAMSGALFVVSHAARGLLPADLRVVEAFGVLVAGVVADRLRIVDLEHRLARIAGLADPAG